MPTRPGASTNPASALTTILGCEQLRAEPRPPAPISIRCRFSSALAPRIADKEPCQAPGVSENGRNPRKIQALFNLKKWHFSFAPPVKLEVAIETRRGSPALLTHRYSGILLGILPPSKSFRRDTLRPKYPGGGYPHGYRRYFARRALKSSSAGFHAAAMDRGSLPRPIAVMVSEFATSVAAFSSLNWVG